MGLTRAERELDEFLDAQPSWLRKILLQDYSFTAEEQRAWCESDWAQNGGVIEDEFLALLARCPKRLAEYHERKKQRALETALLGVPPLRPGRRREDAIAEEAEELSRAGLSPAKIAAELNHRHPDRKDKKAENPKPFTAAGIGKLLQRRKSRVKPDKI